MEVRVDDVVVSEQRRLHIVSDAHCDVEYPVHARVSGTSEDGVVYLLVSGGQLRAVIDFGGLNIGDPACDLQPAWSVFDGDSHARFRAELAADDASWLRGRGWSLLHSVCALDYCWDTNPTMVRQAWRALAQVLADSA